MLTKVSESKMKTIGNINSSHVYLIHGGQCLWIVKNLPVRWDVVLWITALLHYNARQLYTLLNIRGDITSWVRVIHEIIKHYSSTNNDNSTVDVHSIIGM